MTEKIAEINNLKAYYMIDVDGAQQSVRAVDDVSFSINRGEILGITGESGCGKSTLIKVLFGFINPPLRVVDGHVYYYLNGDEKQDLLTLNTKALTGMRWSFFSYIPQASLSMLNPTMRIINQFQGIIKAHTKQFDRKEAKKLITERIQTLGLPLEVLTSFPHQLSGGMRQRVVIAIATILHPQILFADEPTTALDVIVQRGIIQLLRQIQKELKNTLVVVTHDMGLQAQITDRIAVTYAGNIVELASTSEIFKAPQHPYTQFLINSLPMIGDRSKKISISGRPPSLVEPPPGCRFHPRCPQAKGLCEKTMPFLVEVKPGHYVACHI